MFALSFSIGPEIPICIVLMAFFMMRMKVSPRAYVRIKVPASKLWAQLVPYDGKIDHWGRTQIHTSLVSNVTKSFAIRYETTQTNGTVRNFHARFALVEEITDRLMVLKREGLEGKSTNNELLEIRHELLPQGDATQLTTTYVWGSRPMLAQLLARADLWGGIFRIKALAETGKSNSRAYWLINGAIALITGLMSIAAFAWFFRMITSSIPWPVAWIAASFLVLALLVHEFGHVLAFRLIGQPWGRMVFLPFLGAVAVPRLPYESQAQAVFAALMGPGFSILLAGACVVPKLLGWEAAFIFTPLGWVTAVLNVFNMLPAEPLDGGVALRPILTRLIGSKAWSALVLAGSLVVTLGVVLGQIWLVIFGLFAVVANLWRRKPVSLLTPLTSLQLCIAVLGYVVIASAHFTMMTWFFRNLGG